MLSFTQTPMSLLCYLQNPGVSIFCIKLVKEMMERITVVREQEAVIVIPQAVKDMETAALTTKTFAAMPHTNQQDQDWCQSQTFNCRQEKVFNF